MKWFNWSKSNLVDSLLPMIYTPIPFEFKRVINEIASLHCLTPIFPVIGVFFSEFDQNTLNEEINIVRMHKLNGFVIFREKYFNNFTIPELSASSTIPNWYDDPKYYGAIIIIIICCGILIGKWFLTMCKKR
ncbi:MAG: hypothetical protein ACPL0C_04980 [Candidatus Bathyarchaeales archaeon]